MATNKKNGALQPTRPDKLAKDGILRLQIARAIVKAAEKLGLSRAELALIVRDAASQMSRLMTGHVHEFSADRLALEVLALGGDVEVVLRFPRYAKGQRKFRRGKTRVTVKWG